MNIVIGVAIAVVVGSSKGRADRAGRAALVGCPRPACPEIPNVAISAILRQIGRNLNGKGMELQQKYDSRSYEENPARGNGGLALVSEDFEIRNSELSPENSKFSPRFRLIKRRSSPEVRPIRPNAPVRPSVSPGRFLLRAAQSDPIRSDPIVRRFF
ncbi:hypothetical protein CRG98_038399 [Punica granatum]|uniref:Uncharacterized protein n=1 Tax=Punica granatum TaxID=22663 RepID=A0A2I0IB39_PUNGR|nr:hypothetical protein CRG98_038399 [Punica granatum]